MSARPVHITWCKIASIVCAVVTNTLQEAMLSAPSVFRLVKRIVHRSTLHNASCNGKPLCDTERFYGAYTVSHFVRRMFRELFPLRDQQHECQPVSSPHCQCTLRRLQPTSGCGCVPVVNSLPGAVIAARASSMHPFAPLARLLERHTSLSAQVKRLPSSPAVIMSRQACSS